MFGALFQYGLSLWMPTVLAAAFFFVMSPYMAIIDLQAEIANRNLSGIKESVDIDATRDFYFDWLEKQSEGYRSIGGKAIDGIVDAVAGDGLFGSILKIVPFGEIFQHNVLVELRRKVDGVITETVVARYVASVIDATAFPSDKFAYAKRLNQLVQSQTDRDRSFRHEYTSFFRFELSRGPNTVLLCRHGLVRWEICGFHGEDFLKREARPRN